MKLERDRVIEGERETEKRMRGREENGRARKTKRKGERHVIEKDRKRG